MMRTLLVLLLCLSLVPLWSLSTHAISGTSLVACYSGDTDARDITNQFNASMASGIGANDTVAKINRSFIFNTPSTPGLKLPLGACVTKNCSFNFWYNASSTTGFQVFLATPLGSTDGFSFYGAKSSSTYFFVGKGGCGGAEVGAGTSANTWYMATLVRDVTNNVYYLYSNAANIQNLTTCQNITSTNFSMGLNPYDSSNKFSGRIDEVLVFNRTLNQSEITELYNSSNGVSCAYVSPPPGVTAVPTFVAPTPANLTTNNTQVTLNLSCAGERVYIWFDNSSDPTTAVLSNSTTWTYTTNVSSDTATYRFKGACYNASTGLSANTSVFTWTYDAVSPNIVLNANNEFNAQNYSVRSQYDDVLSLNVTFSDDHSLFGYSVNVTRGGVVYFNKSNESLSSLTYNYSASVSTVGWATGRYNVELQVSDSHTKNEIKPYRVTKENKKLRFVTDEGNDISIESEEDATTEAVKTKDRYEFSFTAAKKGRSDKTYHVKSDNPIVYLPDSSYKAHFVVKNRAGGNWVDFEGVSGTPVVRKVTENHYTVTFRDAPNKMDFKSIGGLNVLSVNYSFYVGNYSTSAPDVFRLENVTMGINVSYDSTTMRNATAVLLYNGTSYVVSPTVVGSTFVFTQLVLSPNVSALVPINWTVNVTQFNNVTTSFSMVRNHSVTDFSIIPCGSPAFVNWTQNDEDIPLNTVEGFLTVEVLYWTGDKANAKLYNASLGSGHAWGLCFNPATGVFHADIYAQNYVPGGFTHRFYVQNATFTNTTTVYQLFAPTNGSVSLYSDLKLTARYVADYKYFKNVVAQLQRKYLDTGIWRTVQWDKTGDFGLLFFDIREQSVDYRIIYLDENNSVLKTTDSLKFVCTGGVCELTQLLDPALGSAQNSNVSSTLVYNNATGVITSTWSGNPLLSTTVLFKVQKQIMGSSTTICSTSQTGNGGTFTCNTTGYTGTVYVTLTANGEPYAAAWVDLAGVKLGSLMGQGLSTLVTFILMLTIVGFGMFSPWALVLTTVLGLVVVFFLGIFTPITVGFVVLAAVVGLVIGTLVKQ